MKRLIVCIDGTWNNPEQEDNGIPAPTNVYKIHNAIAETDGDIKQLKFYHSGVGGEGAVSGEGGFLAPVLGGAIGVGTTRHICSAYHWLGVNYEAGDEIYIYGFSRGAFTARSLGGMLGRGLLNLSDLDSKESWARVHKAFKKAYSRKGVMVSSLDSTWEVFHEGNACKVRFVGVWDTVGALGIPDDLEVVNLFDNSKKWRFHDITLGEHILSARHAMAIDEVRSSFTVAKWDNTSEHDDAKEMWFPGVHSDVGGGYADNGLSTISLVWMIEESEIINLKFRAGVISDLNKKADPSGALHNSFKGIFSKLRSRPRNVDAAITANSELFHPSVFIRQKKSPLEHASYRTTKILKVDEAIEVDIFADTQWNYTGLYLTAGHSYIFKGKGSWQDSQDTCGWEGTQDRHPTKGDIIRAVGTFFGKFEGLFKKLTNNHTTDFLGTKRAEHIDWFTLTGAIANDGEEPKGVKNDGSAYEHEYISLPEYESKAFKVKDPGYLYCFPNDVWSLYGNNKGAIQLTITRTS